MNTLSISIHNDSLLGIISSSLTWQPLHSVTRWEKASGHQRETPTKPKSAAKKKKEEKNMENMVGGFSLSHLGHLFFGSTTRPCCVNSMSAVSSQYSRKVITSLCLLVENYWALPAALSAVSNA